MTNALRNVLRNVDTDFEKQISPQAIKDVVKECHNLEAGTKNQSPTQTSQNFERFETTSPAFAGLVVFNPVRTNAAPDLR